MSAGERLVRLAMAESAATERLHALDYTPTIAVAVKAAIEQATRVRITDAMIQAARPGTTPGSVVWKRTRGRIERALVAAGFEVQK